MSIETFGKAVSAAKIFPESKRNSRQLQAAFSAAVIDHSVVSFIIGNIHLIISNFVLNHKHRSAAYFNLYCLLRYRPAFII